MKKAETKVQRYKSYKDSGVEWLGDIPYHWECIRMKHLYKDVSIKNRPNELLSSVTQDRGVIPRDWIESRMVMPSGNLDAFKFIEKEDFAISLRSFEGGLEYCYHNGIISPAYTVLKKKKDNLFPLFYKYLFKSISFISELQTSVVGIREGKNISYSELSYSSLPIPPLTEQTKIAQFLDDKTTKIDDAIAIKEQQINLLKERKQILIHKVVTRGLDDSVSLKDSGVEWIGEIPEQCEVKRLKYFANIQGGFAFNSSDFKDEGIQIIKIANTYMNRLSLDRQPTFVDKSYLQSHKDWVVSKDDILMSLTGTLGKKDYGFAILIDDDTKYLLNQRVAKITAKHNFEPEYLVILLQSDSYLNQLYCLPAGTKQANLSNDNVVNIKMPIPPLNERVEISEFIASGSEKIETAIGLKQQEIDTLKEYKRSLINGVVTGKVRVC